MTEGQNRYCVKICVLSSPPLNQCFTWFFFSGGSGYLKSQTEHPGLLKMKTTGRKKKTQNKKNMKLNHNPRQNNLTNVQ